MFQFLWEVNAVVSDILYFSGCSDLIITCQKEQIRIWDMVNMKEVRRHVIGSMTCNAVAISDDGTFLPTGKKS